jgi:hypothetical protein
MKQNKTWETTIYITQTQIEQMYNLIKEAEGLEGPNSPYRNGRLNNVRFTVDMEPNKWAIFSTDCKYVEYTIEADCLDGRQTPIRHSVKQFNYRSDDASKICRSKNNLESITEKFKR